MNPAARATKPRLKSACLTGVNSLKNKLRRILLEKRNSLSENERRIKSRLIAKSIRSLPAYKNAKTLMFYLTHGSEVKTEGMILQAFKDKKTVVVPVTDTASRRLNAAKLCSLKKDIEIGAYGIRGPKKSNREIIAPEKIDMVFTPGIAFDISGNRIGYGMGYYDSWLKNLRKSKRIGISFDCQVLKSLKCGMNDEPVGIIVTEKRIIRGETE